MDSMTKRFIDIIAAGLGLILLAPLLVAIGILVRLRDGSPVIYRATRVGRNGRLFHLFKFRTMVTAPKSGESSLGSSVTVWDDPRVTPLGRTLRRHKLDELPQLLNVLSGEMSLVGPRPEDPEYVALYTEEQRRVLSAKPGITGVAALRYSDEETLLRGDDWEQVYRERIMPAKIQLEIDYLARRSLLTDMVLIVQTFAKLLRRSPRASHGGPNG
jgi:lipopolysaccharide/colanic/teichoic acid biosynthesis glycosyltransferase